MDWLEYENAAREKGYKNICGVDEAGRGPIAGPVCAAAVILPKDCKLEGLNDSKKLTEKKREHFFEIIKEQAIDFGIGFASVEEIDDINILNATYLAMKRAVGNLKTKPDWVMVDGNLMPPLDGLIGETIVMGDAKSLSIAAASVLAKVSRDKILYELAEKYPQYGFEKHKGYGTKLHRAAIEEFGVLEEHRKKFVRKFLEK